MALKTAALIAALAACGGTHKVQNQDMSNTATDGAKLAQLKAALAEARKQSDSYLSGEALPARADVARLVDGDATPWWEQLAPVEAFLLFETSKETAARAPADARAQAYCAGVEAISAEWWGTPGAPQTEVAKRAIALGAPVAKCLGALFENDRRITYKDGETRGEAKQLGWTVADLAAGLAARIVGGSYEASAPAADRAAARAALKQKL
jgi:hypothetical protein